MMPICLIYAVLIKYSDLTAKTCSNPDNSGHVENLTPNPWREGENSKPLSLKEERNRSEVFQILGKVRF
jgi:hypothetical protein